MVHCLAGIGIKTYANPEVERNRIHHGGAMGLICNENGAGVIRNNEFYSNGCAHCSAALATPRLIRVHLGSSSGPTQQNSCQSLGSFTSRFRSFFLG